MLDNIKEEFELARRLAHIRRYAGADYRGQSVAEHSYFVGLLARIWAVNAGHSGINGVGDPIFNWGPSHTAELMMLALCHDLPEAVTGDILYPTKQVMKSMSVDIAQIENEMMRKAKFDWLPMHPRSLNQIATDFTTVEITHVENRATVTRLCRKAWVSLAVHVCDMLELVLYCEGAEDPILNRSYITGGAALIDYNRRFGKWIPPIIAEMMKP